MNKFEIIVKYLFFILILIPLADLALNILPENVNNEKRELVSKKNESSLFGKIYRLVSDYERDFRGRSLLINSYINLKKLLPGNNPLPQKVIIGDQGYYYLTDFNCMDDYRNVKKWSEDELKLFINKLLENKLYLEKRNIPYVIVVVPDKQRIYPEFIPKYITKISNTSQLDVVKKYLEMNKIDLNLIDLGPILLENKNLDLYLRKDSHWNSRGAFIGYQNLMNKISHKYPIHYDTTYKSEIIDYEENDLDLAKLLGESFYATEKSRKVVLLNAPKATNFDPGFVISEYIMKKKPNYLIAKENPQGKGKLLMFRDSYTGYWSDYFVSNFNKSAFVWKYDFDTTMVSKFNPDIVIQEVAERHLNLLK
jgi:alginate O-acetyltransferase complex protein AlgJ